MKPDDFSHRLLKVVVICTFLFGLCTFGGMGDGGAGAMPLWTYEAEGSVSSVELSADGDFLAFQTEDNVYLFDNQGRKLWSYEPGSSVEDVTISSDGRYIAAATHFPDSRVYFFARDSSSKQEESSAANAAAMSSASVLTVQAYEEEWNRTFGGSKEDVGFSVQQSSDGGYILAGRTQSYGAGDADAWLIKVDSEGNELWNRTFGGRKYDAGNSVYQAGDGGYVMAGTTRSYGAGKMNVWLIKADSGGNELWNRTFGGPESDEGNSVQQTSDGGYIIAGRTESFHRGSSAKSSNYPDLWLIKTDREGNELWNRTFGSEMDLEEGYSVLQTSDGGYVVAGDAYSYALLIKTDSRGGEEWNRTFGTRKGTADDRLYSVQQTGDGGYVIAGSTESYGSGRSNAWLIKADSDGRELLNRTFGEGSSGARCIQQTGDGGYLMAGWTESRGAGSSDIWLIKADSEGRELWNRTFGGPNMDESRSVQQTSDGGYIIVGSKDGDLWLIKVKDQAVSSVPPLNLPLAAPAVQPSGGEAPPQNATAVINLRNYDQDEIEAALYADGKSIGAVALPPKSQRVQYVPVLSGYHAFLMGWKDPDTGEKVHRAENNATFQPGDVRKVNLNVAENKGTNAEVYVMNKYPAELEVFLDINEGYKGSKIIPPGSYMRLFGTYPVPPGRNDFSISWEDPDTGQAFLVESNQTFQEGESRAVKLVAARKGPALEIRVRPARLAMEAGDSKNLEIAINNTGDETAKLVDLVLLSQDTKTAVLSTTSLTIGDLLPGQSWEETSFPPYLRALKEGETAVEVRARADGAEEVAEEVKVVVLGKGELSFKEEDLGEPAEIRQSDLAAREAFGGSGDFPAMLDAAEEGIMESFSKDGVEAVLAVQSAGKAGFAAKGQKLKATLAIANENSYAVGVAAAIVPPPQEAFRYSEGSYRVTVQSPMTTWYKPDEHYALANLLVWPGMKIMESFEAIDEWTWRNFQAPMQLLDGGGIFILEPGYVMIFSSEITPQQSGYLDLQGEIYYTKGPRETYTYGEMVLPFALGIKGAEADLARLEHVTLAKSVQVEEKRCRLGGLICY